MPAPVIEAHRRRIVIVGAAGRDFHNFNVVPRYPEGIPIVAEAELDALLATQHVDEVVFAYSDVSHAQVMHIASRALAGGADFALLGPRRTMLAARLPVIAVSAVRTGCGKSQTARYLSRRLRERGLRVAVLRHPMPYGDLARQAVQRFATRADLDAADCTIEEREEYEPHLALGSVVHAGIDTQRVLDAAAQDADLILWDGGNNDFPFIRPDLHIVLADALRPGQEATHHPGEAVLRMADVVVIAKSDAAPRADVTRVEAAVRRINPRARRLRGASPVTLDDPGAARGRRVLVVEDGPTTTHGGMAHGAGYAAALHAGAEIIDPRACAAPAIAPLYAQYPQLGPVLPAMGYSASERAALAATIEASRAELVVSGTPHDLAALLGLTLPVLRARYEFAEVESPGLWGEVDAFLRRARLAR
ncbi:MAG: GTPase [Betaproteobacteria bacterium SG8_39]|nr:MAG: GTPase [Betaproteobacteria bacterium SG8_39]